MKVAILGTRGIPNNYGGFEQFAEYLSQGLAQAGHQVYVYNPHNHIYQQHMWNQVHIIHQYDPEYKFGTAGQYIYDLNCILDSRKKNFDLILQLGYTSNSVWGWLLPRKITVILTNMDGLEWSRSKYSKQVQLLLKYAERWAVKTSDYLIADSIGIQKYLKWKYNKESKFIPYGAHLFDTPNVDLVGKQLLIPYTYDMLVARLEPENSIEIILQAVIDAKVDRPFLVIGNYQSSFGKYLKNKYSNKRIMFLGSIYDINLLNNLRYFSNLYFHGHTVGGTNPSLLEAMASSALICAHNNDFNSAILEEDAYYFTDTQSAKNVLDTVNKADLKEYPKIKRNLEKIRTDYAWKKIIASYEEYMLFCLREKNNNL